MLTPPPHQLPHLSDGLLWQQLSDGEDRIRLYPGDQPHPQQAGKCDFCSGGSHRHHGLYLRHGAISCCLELFQPGEHIVCSEDLYGGTNRILKTVSGKNGITSTFLDPSDPAQVEAALRPETKAVYLETPTNPMMMVMDIAAIAAITKPRNILLIVDNTVQLRNGLHPEYQSFQQQ